MARAAPPAPDDRGRACLGAPERRTGAEIGDEAIAIGIVGKDRAVSRERHGIGRPDADGRFRCAVGKGKRGLLVRDGHVAADETHLVHGTHGLGEVARRDVDRDVISRNAVLAQPVAMHRRRALMRHGRTDDGCERNTRMMGHVSRSPRT